MRRIFGDGTDVLISLWVKAFRRKAEANVDPEKFLQLLRRGDPESVEKVRHMLKELVIAYHEVSKKGNVEA
ncbi:hypothetical protein KEJ24_01640 [Candidatus Bathyarchaeota archaeon]|nr:hypothetical protein [Candidatus Bathyarchaeota archaeon]